MAHIVVIDDESEICDLPETLNPPPDFILLDVLMPGINGLECMPQIQSLAPKARVIVITGLNDYHLADAFYEAGAFSFLNKPLHHRQILSTIQRVLNTPAPPSDYGDYPLPCT